MTVHVGVKVSIIAYITLVCPGAPVHSGLEGKCVN